MSATIVVVTVLLGDPGVLLQQSREQYALGEFERSLQLLDRAEQLSTERGQLAAIYLHAGVVHEVLRRPREATVAFVRALRCGPEVQLDAARHKRSAVELFELARAVMRSGADASVLQLELQTQPKRDATVCVDPSPPDAPLTKVAPQAPAAVRPTWPIYVFGGAAVAGLVSGVAFGALARSKDSECSLVLTPQSYTECDAAASRLEIGANASFVASGVAALAGAAVWVLWDTEVAVTPTSGGGAVTLWHRF